MILAHNQFLQVHLFPLQMMPRLSEIRERSQSAARQEPTTAAADTASPQPPGNHSSYWLSHFNALSSASNEDLSKAVDVDTPEKQEFRKVLIEQANQLEQQLEEATRKRKFDDVRALSTNLDDIRRTLSEL